MGSEIAVKLAQIQCTRHRNSDISTGGAESYRRRNHRLREERRREKEASSSNWQPVVIGGSILDLTAKIRSHKIKVSEIRCLMSEFFLDGDMFLLRMRELILEAWYTRLEVWPEM